MINNTTINHNLSQLCSQPHHLQQQQQPQSQQSSLNNHDIILSSQSSLPSPQQDNTIVLKNMNFHPQQLILHLHQSLKIKVSHNNNYQLSQISTKKKFIFSIQQLQVESDPIQEGQEYVFEGGDFCNKGEYKLRCINIPKIYCLIRVIESNSQELLQQLVADFIEPEQLPCNNITTSLAKSSLIKLSSVNQQQQTEEQQNKQTIQSIQQKPFNNNHNLPATSLQQYERMLAEQLDNDPNSPTLSRSSKNDSLQNKYLNYFKQEFKLWRAFFEQQEVKQQRMKQQNNQPIVVVEETQTISRERQQSSVVAIQQHNGNQQNVVNARQVEEGISYCINSPSLVTTIEAPIQKLNNQTIILPSPELNLKKSKRNPTTHNTNTKTNTNPNNNNNNRKKLSLKSTPPYHNTPTVTPQKNLSLSQVKQIDPSSNAKSQQEYDLSSNSSSSSTHTNNSKLITSHVHSHLHSHQQIVDRSHHDYSYREEGEINRTNRKQMKKTNSEYGFNVLRLEQQQEKYHNLDRISVFGKQQQGVNIVCMGSSRDRLSEVQKKGDILSTPNNNIAPPTHNTTTTPNSKKNNNPISSSRKSMSRTQTNSPIMKQYKKQNNFLAWAIQWAKQKDYQPVNIQKLNDHHLIKQFSAYMKNKFKVTQFMYC